MSTAFFYGTLMHPQILRRVIGNDGKHLRICSAILPEYTRHQVKYADYPGIVSYETSKEKFDLNLEPEQRSVKGSLVSGLTSRDMELLDIFEGTEYTTQHIQAWPLGPFTSLVELETAVTPSVSAIPLSTSADLEAHVAITNSVYASTYVYGRIDDLNASLWSYEDFVKQNAWKWIGGQHGRAEEVTAAKEIAEHDQYYADVDKCRVLDCN